MHHTKTGWRTGCELVAGPYPVLYELGSELGARDLRVGGEGENWVRTGSNWVELGSNWVELGGSGQNWADLGGSGQELGRSGWAHPVPTQFATAPPNNRQKNDANPNPNPLLGTPRSCSELKSEAPPMGF